MFTQKDIHTVLLAGAGIMGSSFAQIFAKSGYNVILYDIVEEALPKAEKLIRVNLDTQVKENSISQEVAKEIFSRITMTTSKESFSTVDFVLEATAERMDIKHAFFKELSALAKDDAILCSNTSGMSITKIAEAVEKPERFAGMHWVNPPHLIPLVEVISGKHSNENTLQTVYDIALSLGQKPVRVYKDPTGFILNRLQYAVVREACHCVEMGYASIEDVDNVMKYGLGMRYACIGPFETMDFGGIDTFNKVGSYMFDALCNDGGVPKILKEAYDDGKFGVKNCNGFYDYDNGKDVVALDRRDRAFIAVSKALAEE